MGVSCVINLPAGPGQRSPPERNYLLSVPWNGTYPWRAFTAQPQKIIAASKTRLLCLPRNPWFGIGGVVMALGEFGVASLEETSALCPRKHENFMIRSIFNARYFWDRMLGFRSQFPHGRQVIGHILQPEVFKAVAGG